MASTLIRVEQLLVIICLNNSLILSMTSYISINKRNLYLWKSALTKFTSSTITGFIIDALLLYLPCHSAYPYGVILNLLCLIGYMIELLHVD